LNYCNKHKWQRSLLHSSGQVLLTRANGVYRKLPADSWKFPVTMPQPSLPSRSVWYLDAQRRGELVGWATSTESCFYPPDGAQLGIDLAALVVVRVPKADAIARAGEKLLRSGGFGLVVLDLGLADIPTPLQSRLNGLAHHHHTALVCLTEKDSRAFSLGSLVSLRVHAERRGLEKTSLVAAYRSSKTNGEDLPGRTRNCGMDRRDCAELARCQRESKRI